MKTHYVLIDYENVQPATVAMLDQEHVKIVVFVGASQTKITFEIAAALQRMGSRAEYVKICGNGPNALDFHIAFYIGQLAAREPDASFHVISKDTGFDPLIQYLRNKKVQACRSADVAEIPFVKVASAKSPDEKLTVIVTNLKQRGASKPRTVQTLTGTISSIFQKKLSAEEVSSLMRELQKQGIVMVSDTKVSYVLPA